MRKFREFISEEIMPFAQTEKGFVGIDNGPVRDNINLLLANVTTMPYSTPYHAMEAIRRVLISFHIALPATNFLSGESGHEVFPINQFGKKLGALPTGDVVTQMPSAYYVYFEYEMTDSGSFDVFCEIIDEEELSAIMSDIEDEESDAMDHDAEDSYDAYKAANMSEQIVYRGENKDSAKRRKIMSVLHTRKTNKLLPGMHEDYDSNEADMANRAKEFFNSPSKVIQSNARKIYKSHNDKAVTGMKEEEKLDERNMENKKAKDAFVKRTGNAARKAGDPMHLTNKGTGMRTSVANKIRGRELTQGRNRVEEASAEKLSKYLEKVNTLDRKELKARGKSPSVAAGKILKKYSSNPKHAKVAATEETINEVSKQLASKASEKAYDKGSEYYDSTTKLRGKAFKSKDKGDMEKAAAEQGKMSKKWKQSMKFKAYADKKMEEETINEISAGKANDAYHAAADKGKTADVMAGATGSKKWRKKANKKWDQARKFADYADKKKLDEDKKVVTATKKSEKGTKWKLTSRNPDSEGSEMELRQGKRKKMTGYYDRNASMFTMSKTKGGKFDPKSKQKDYDHAKDIMKTVKEDAPFDNPTEKPSTPYKNPAAKSKQLARAAMKAAMEKAKSEKK